MLCRRAFYGITWERIYWTHIYVRKYWLNGVEKYRYLLGLIHPAGSGWKILVSFRRGNLPECNKCGTPYQVANLFLWYNTYICVLGGRSRTGIYWSHSHAFQWLRGWYNRPEDAGNDNIYIEFLLNGTLRAIGFRYTMQGSVCSLRSMEKALGLPLS